MSADWTVAKGITITPVVGVLQSLDFANCFVQFGEKIAEGPPSAIIEDPRVVEAYFGEHGDVAH